MRNILCMLLTVIALPLIAEPTCALCEIHKAYNKDHPGDYEYYDDYLKATEGKETSKKKNPLPKPSLFKF